MHAPRWPFGGRDKKDHQGKVAEIAELKSATWRQPYHTSALRVVPSTSSFRLQTIYSSVTALCTSSLILHQHRRLGEMAQQYQYAFTVQAHTSDVRHILAPQAGVPLLLSGSRDGSACLLGPSSSGASSGGGSGFGNSAAQSIGEEWDAKLRVEGPEKRFVSCVGMVRADGEGELSV